MDVDFSIHMIGDTGALIVPSQMKIYRSGNLAFRCEWPDPSKTTRTSSIKFQSDKALKKVWVVGFSKVKSIDITEGFDASVEFTTLTEILAEIQR